MSGLADAEALLVQLERAAATLGLQVSYEPFDPAVSDGGLCRVRGKLRVIVDRDAPPRRKADALAAALRRARVEGLDLDGVFLAPAARRLIDASDDDDWE